jgi:eukaryotic-like serine/threonine-protein kinase
VTRPAAIEEHLLGLLLAEKYQLVEVQASGAFGTVFKADQYFCGRLVRTVAVKVSRQTGLTEETAPALFGDALILARILAGADCEGKQHLVPIHDMGILAEHDRRGYLVMEYVDGHPLLAHMRAAGRVSVASGLRYLKEVCRALALVHAQGAVHRDLKPDNILLDRRGVVRVVDFGLAAFTDHRLGFVPGSMGTFTYMAPETVAGQATPASDVYGLGLLAYELFTGGGPHLTAPWSSEDSAARQRENQRIKRGLRFPPPSESHNEVRYDHRWLDAVILRCLEPDPARRYRDAGQLLAALEACAAGESSEGPGERERGDPAPSRPAEQDELLREVRRLLARSAWDEVIQRLEVYRPAEWAVIDTASGRALRLLGQAYLGRGDLRTARDCLEQLHNAQREQPLLERNEYAAALSDLVRCHRGLGETELAAARREEARRVLLGHQENSG